MRVLLTGAGGVVGFEVLKQLIEAKYEVTIVELKNRHNQQKLVNYKKLVDFYWGDICDERLMEKLIENQDVIIHLAAVIPPLADENHQLTKKVNYGGTKNIINAIKKTNEKCFFIFASSISVYGDRLDDYEICEYDIVKASEGDYYAEVKILTEKLIINSLKNYVIFRLTGVMDRPKLTPLLFNMPLNTKLEIITVRDLAKAFVNSVEQQLALNGKIFNVGGGVKCRVFYRDFLKKCFEIYGLNYRYLDESAFAKKNFHCGYYVDSELNGIVNYQSETLEDYYDYLQKSLPKSQVILTKALSYLIVKRLNYCSEPRSALKSKNKQLIKRFYG